MISIRHSLKTTKKVAKIGPNAKIDIFSNKNFYKK